MDDAGIPFVWADVPGHLSYLIIAISYWLTNIYWLRLTAIVGLALEIVYFRMAGGALHAGIAWDVVFILINACQIWRLVADRRALASLAEVQLLRHGAFAGFDSVELASVLRTGAWRDFEPGTRLTEEGKPVAHLVLICDGQASVEVGGETIANLHGGTFVGEMAFLSGNPASATVTVARQTRAFVFNTGKLEALARENRSVAGDLYRAIGRDLARKLARGTQCPAQQEDSSADVRIQGGGQAERGSRPQWARRSRGGR